jgi:hypothetical protein
MEIVEYPQQLLLGVRFPFDGELIVAEELTENLFRQFRHGPPSSAPPASWQGAESAPTKSIIRDLRRYDVPEIGAAAFRIEG